MAQLQILARPYHAGMIQRTDLITAARVDATLILLPLIGWLEASFALAASNVPIEVAARVMSVPMARRSIDKNQLLHYR